MYTMAKVCRKHRDNMVSVNGNTLQGEWCNARMSQCVTTQSANHVDLCTNKYFTLGSTLTILRSLLFLNSSPAELSEIT